MRRRISRAELRFARRNPRTGDQDEHPIDYDAAAIMDTVDRMHRNYRELINEHGFTAVVRCLQETKDIHRVRAMLAQRHEYRQQQLANGWF